METLAERLKICREKLGLTQTQLAKNAKLKNQSIIGSLESGYRKSSAYIPQIAEALGVESLWLTTGKPPMTREEARTIQVSDTAMKIAIAVNEMPQSYQEALLHLITLEQMKREAQITQDQSLLLPQK